MAGCAGSPSSSTTSAGTSTSASAEETVITFGIHVANPESQEAGTWQIVQAFNEAYAGKYKVEFQAADTETLTTNMMLQATDGTLPEIFWMGASQAPEYAESGYLLDLSDFLSQNEAVDTALGGMEDAFNNGSMQYGLPYQCNVQGFFYNKDILAQAGYTEFPTQWDEFETMLKTIKEEMPDVTPWFIFGSEAWHLGHLIEFIPHGYLKSTLGTIECKKAMLANDQDVLRFADPDGAMAVFAQNMLDLQSEGLINADVLTATNDNCVQDFANGKAAMFSNGMWALSSVLEANPDMADKIGFAPYPAYMEGSEPVVLSAEDSGYSISATTEHKEECIEFLNFLFSADNQKKYSEVAKAPSAFKDVQAEWAPTNIVEEVNAALENAVNIGYTNEKPAGFSGDDAGRYLQNLLAGQYDAQGFAEAYAQAWNDGMAS